jgi:capsular polysaccharide biosynthesis protein
MSAHSDGGGGDIAASPGIGAAEQQFLMLYRAFTRYEGAADVAAIVKLWGRLQSRGSQAETTVVAFRGWISRRSGLRLSKSALGQQNPAYKVSVRRLRREDAPTNPIRDGVRTGYRVVAEGRDDPPPFDFFAVDKLNRRTLPQPVNEDVGRKMSASLWVASPSRVDTSGFSYLDEASISLPGFNSELSKIVVRYPIACLDIVNQPAAHGFAGLVSAALGRAPLLDREFDRATLISEHQMFHPRSDLTRLRVQRRDSWSVMTGPVMTPIPRVDGPLVNYTDGNVPLPSPSRKWHVVENAIVQSSGTVYSEGCLVAYEAAADPSINQIPSPPVQTVFGSTRHPGFALVLKRPPAETYIDEAILISGRHDLNWYHWMAEYLPRVFTVPQTIDASVPLLVGDRVPAEGLRALRAITKRPILMSRYDTAQSVGRLHLSAPIAQVLDTTRVPWALAVAIDGQALRNSRDRLLEAANAQHLEPTRLIFTRRNSKHRGLVNESELFQVATNLGFESIDPTSMTWEEQIRAFRSASVIVGAAGAAMANYQFMSPGTQAVGLTAAGLEGFILPAAISSASGIRYSAVVGNHIRPLSVSTSKIDWIHSDVFLSLSTFEKALVKVLERRLQPKC